MSHPKRIALTVLSGFVVMVFFVTMTLNPKEAASIRNVTAYERIKQAAVSHCENQAFVGYEYVGQHYKADSDGWYEVTFVNEMDENLVVFVYGKSVYEDAPLVRDTAVEKSLSDEMTAYAREILAPSEWCIAFTDIYGVPHQSWPSDSSLESVMQEEVLRTDWYLAVLDGESVTDAGERLAKQMSDKGWIGSIHAQSFDTETFFKLDDAMSRTDLRDLFGDGLWINVSGQ